jgi:amino acid adenylation domain-containing protein
MLDVVDGRSLRTDVARQAALHPDAPALVVRGETLSYAALDAGARRLATLLVAAGRPERVGVFAYRSPLAYVATLGALYAGAAYVPLNQKFPVERTRAMIRRARLDAIVVDRTSAPQLAEALEGIEPRPRLVAPEPEVAELLRAAGLEVLGADAVAAAEPLAELPPVLPDDVAYLLFTSGTTGEPKGVGVTHANALHFLDAVAQRYPLGPGDRCSQTFDQTFDLAVCDLFIAWHAGACLVVPQPMDLLAPVRFVTRHELTLWFSVPSAAALAVKKGMLAPGSMPSLRYSLFCGEPLPEATARAWAGAADRSVVENLYGPTELTIACLVYRWQDGGVEGDNGIVAIGRPLPGLGALVVDEALAPVDDGAVGELLVCGPQTTPGYWLDEARTRERFVDVAVSETRSKRFYRTGDRVRRTAGGDYVYVGRTDNQVKVLGFRVELGEIESVLLRQPGVVEAIAAGWPVEDGRATGIVAFVSGSADLDALPKAAAAVLPDYMVPRRILRVDEMPLNANGKIDRKALMAMLQEGEPAATPA